MMDFIFDKNPMGIIVFDKGMNIVSSNSRGKYFLKRHEIPADISALGKKIFDAIGNGKLKELFPGEICLSKKLDGSSSRWIFRIETCERPDPFVCLFIREDSLADKLDLNGIRQQFGLSRRETDVLRRTITGVKNTDVAEDINISEQTVKDYLSKVYSKSGVKNKFELVAYILNFPAHANTFNAWECRRKKEVKMKKMVPILTIVTQRNG